MARIIARQWNGARPLATEEMVYLIHPDHRMQAEPNSKAIIDLIHPFLDYCEIEKGLADNTQRNYSHYLQLFVGWLRKTGNADLLPHQLTTKHIWNYRLYLARSYKDAHGKHLSKKSQNNYLIALRALSDFLAERDIDTLPSSKIRLAKQKNEHTVSFLERRDLEAMLRVPDTTTPIGSRDRAIMELLFSSGLRVAELVALNVDQVAFLRDRNTTRTYELSIVGKGKHVRTIFISPRAAEWLRAYLACRRDVYDPLFLNYRATDAEATRLSARSIQKIISRAALLAGLSKKVTPHTLRHTYATDLLSHGADLRSVQELLGHKNVATTQIYTHVTNKRLRDIHEKFHGGQADGR
jgi:site-specific recombinase XerD